MIDYDNLDNLSLSELKKLEHKLEYDISKFDVIQSTKKVQLNSAYGALGNQYFRFYDIRQAEAVTVSGQLVIKWIEKEINEYLNKLLKTDNVDYILAIDTDSIYILLSDIVEFAFKNKQLPQDDKVIDFLDSFCKDKVQNFIHESYGRLAQYMNVYEQKMHMKRESLVTTGFWTGKKRYALNVYDHEGVRYTKPDIHVKGLESKKSSIPSVCRKKIQEVIELVLNATEGDVIKLIENFREEFNSYNILDVAFPRSVNNIIKYYDSSTIYRKSTPIHVKGSLIYNHLLKQNKIETKYKQIHEGDKIKFFYLKEPNPTQNFVISIPEVLPKEFELDQYIDYEKMFQKTFLDPTVHILNAVKWKHKHETNLENFFVME